MINITIDNSMLAFTTLKSTLDNLSIVEGLLHIEDPLGVDFQVDSYEYYQIGNRARASLVQVHTYTRWGINYCIDAPNKSKITGWVLYKSKPHSVSIDYIQFLDAFAITIDSSATTLVTNNERSQRFCRMWNELADSAQSLGIGSLGFVSNQATFFKQSDGKSYRVKLLEPISSNQVALVYVDTDPASPITFVFDKTSDFFSQKKPHWFWQPQQVILFNLLKE